MRPAESLSVPEESRSLSLTVAVSPAIEAMSGASLVLLIAGVALMFLGILLELLDLAKARATVALEVKDILK